MKEASIPARLIKLRDDLDELCDKAWDEREAAVPCSDADFEAGIKYTRLNSLRELIETAILEMELWE